ncbi:hypothetical protein ILYODFUR_035061 [Ilyodon furcidens]|uniref:Uncharacterized protein n=1 Tax=Ilyodon furcidens TaxID=33524 RepID=A0ABV0TEV2_9TELE
MTVVCSSPVCHEPAFTQVSVPAFYRLDSSSDHVLDFTRLFFSPTTQITSWKHQTIAHLPVYPPIPLALKHCHSEAHTKRDSVLRTSLPLFLPNSASVGELTTSSKPSSTAYSELTSLMSCTIYYLHPNKQ